MQLPLQRRAAERPRRDYAEHRGRGVCRGDRGLRRRQIHPHLRGQRAHTPPLHRRLLRVGDGERAGHRRGQTGGNRPVCRGGLPGHRQPDGLLDCRGRDPLRDGKLRPPPRRDRAAAGGYPLPPGDRGPPPPADQLPLGRTEAEGGDCRDSGAPAGRHPVG